MYEHTQKGALMIVISVLLVLLYAYIWSQADYDMFTSVIMVLVIVLVMSFSTLNVRIDNRFLSIKFGYGIYRKSFQIKEIKSAQIVKNHWYYGWGIRYWFPGKMIIYNVSGLDAVEIKFRDDKIIRIGTDEPEMLESMIKQSIKHR